LKQRLGCSGSFCITPIIFAGVKIKNLLMGHASAPVISIIGTNSRSALAICLQWLQRQKILV